MAVSKEPQNQFWYCCWFRSNDGTGFDISQIARPAYIQGIPLKALNGFLKGSLKGGQGMEGHRRANFAYEIQGVFIKPSSGSFKGSLKVVSRGYKAIHGLS